MRTFLEFLEARKSATLAEQQMNEAFKESDVEKAHKLMLDIWKKNLSGNTAMFHAPIDVTVGGKACKSYIFVNINGSKKTMWSLNYLKSAGSAEVYSVDFWNHDDMKAFWIDGKSGKTTMSIYTMGSSVAYFIPIITHVVSSQKFKLSEEDAMKAAFKSTASKKNESYDFYLGALKYQVVEGLSDDVLEDAFQLAVGNVFEANKDVEQYRWKKKQEADDATTKWRGTKSKEDQADKQRLWDEYKQVLNAIKGGAETMEDLKLAVKFDVKWEQVETEDMKEAEEEFKKQKEDPEVSFKKMQVYIKSVIKGMQPGVIICGAPGIGKTFRVKQQLKAAGYHEGHNLYTIKGTESPRQLYMDMYEYKAKGNIIVIDDADALVGAKAPEVAINVLKAALDSTSDDEGRLVAYKVSGDLKDEEGNPIPKRMYFNAGVIVLTNYGVGQLDTALRGRVFTQTLDFDTEQLLGIIKNIMPKIDPAHLSSKAKIKAYDYLLELNEKKTKMVISIRSFTTAARLYELCDNEDLSEEQVQEMIKEQMMNQALTAKDTKHF